MCVCLCVCARACVCTYTWKIQCIFSYEDLARKQFPFTKKAQWLLNVRSVLSLENNAPNPYNRTQFKKSISFSTVLAHSAQCTVQLCSVPCLGSSTYSTPGPAVQSQRTLQVDVLLTTGARCRKAGRGGGGIPNIVSGGGPMSEHSTHDVLKYINRSTPLAILWAAK